MESRKGGGQWEIVIEGEANGFQLPHFHCSPDFFPRCLSVPQGHQEVTMSGDDLLVLKRPLNAMLMGSWYLPNQVLSKICALSSCHLASGRQQIWLYAVFANFKKEQVLFWSGRVFVVATRKVRPGMWVGRLVWSAHSAFAPH